MMIERAIVQQMMIDGEGGVTMRHCLRPASVLAVAQRMQRWREAPEGCARCRAENAVSIRAGVALGGHCRATIDPGLAGYDLGRRVHPTALRATSSEGLHGLAIVFDSLSVNLGGWFERIAAGAVDRTFTEGSDVLALVDHDPSKAIGRLSAGTLALRKTSTGVVTRIPDPPATTAGTDVIINVRRRDIQGMSFGFIALDDDWTLEGDVIVRTVLDMRVVEVSIVTFPAYLATSIHVGEDHQRHDVDWLRKVHRTRLAR